MMKHKTLLRMLACLLLCAMTAFPAMAEEEAALEHEWVAEDDGTLLENLPTSESYIGTSQYATVGHQKPNARLNLRARPTTNSDSLGQYYNGTSVLILSHASDWCHVQVNGRTGYMMTKFLIFNGVPDDEITYGVLYNQIGGSRVIVRSGPSMNASIIITLSVGTPTTIYTHGGAWSYVQVSGYNGYVATSFLAQDVPPQPAPNPQYVEYAVVANQNPNSRLHLREYASTSSRSLGTYGNGAPVTVLNFGSEWCYVDVYDQLGYMMTRYLAFVDYPLYNEYAEGEYDPGDEIEPFPVVDTENMSPYVRPASEAEPEVLDHSEGNTMDDYNQEIEYMYSPEMEVEEIG